MKEMYDDIIQYYLVKNELKPDIMKFDGFERPPMIEIPEYLEKYKK